MFMFRSMLPLVMGNFMATLYAENLTEGQKNQYIFKKRTHNLETLGGIHKKNATLLKTSLLNNFGKVSSLSHKSGGSLYQKSTN